ncbi:MAG TPA: DUF5687 family protein [Bacteroidales bacterium]|nr:DUF5687 family protein [Bacteroidales bacterium]
MVLKWFISHQWKQLRRSSFWQKSLAINIVLAFLIGLILLELLGIGIMLRKILAEAYPDQDLVAVFNGALLYYFAIDLILRYLMQSLPVMAAQPYFHLPVKKSVIVHYMLAKSLFFILNYLPLLVLIPWAVNSVAVQYSAPQAIIWLLSVVVLIFTNNFIVLYVKRQLFSRPWVVGVFGLVVIGFIVLDNFGLYSISVISANLFQYLIEITWALLVPVFLLVLWYSFNYYYLKARMYLEEISTKKHRKTDSLAGIAYLKSLGRVGELIAVELKLYLRNKRSKSLVYLMPIFLLYGFFFYPQEIYMELGGMLIFVGIFITGGVGMSVGNYFLGWESSYFDAILANNIDHEKYFRAKYLILLGLATFSYVVTIPYAFYGWQILYINTMCFLMNIGVSAYIILLFCTNNKKRMDLSRGAAFNYQGVGASQFLIMLPLLLLPVVLYMIIGIFLDRMAAVTVLGLIGVIGILFHKIWMQKVVERFERRKYIIAEGFRER